MTHTFGICLAPASVPAASSARAPSAARVTRHTLACLSVAMMLAACGGTDTGPTTSNSQADELASSRTPATAPAPSPAAKPAPAPVATLVKATAPAPSPAAVAPAPAPAPAVAVVNDNLDAAPDTTAQATAAAGVSLRGVNLSGAEFGSGSIPGRPNYDYIYPAQTSVAYFKAKGMNFIRLPFLWERLQPTLNGAFNADELARVKEFVAGATANGMTVLIDPHNYAAYRGKAIGSASVPNTAFGDFWARLATEFKGNSKVIFGLMNEPKDVTTEAWVAAANEAIRRIRQAGATNTIAVPGNAWSGAHSWYANWYGTPNAQAMLKVVDSGNNMLIEVHQYLDADSSGTSATCVSTTIGVERLKQFTDWLKANKKRALLGEFAGADNATCKTAVAGMLKYIDDNRGVWAGWTYWAAGPWWGADMFSIEPATGNVDKPLMKTLLQFLL